jgi:hypothetical protein
MQGELVTRRSSLDRGYASPFFFGPITGSYVASRHSSYECEEGNRMPKVPAIQRRIVELDAQYAVAQPKRSARFFRRVTALIIFGLIAVAAFSYAQDTTSDFYRLTLKQGAQAANV